MPEQNKFLLPEESPFFMRPCGCLGLQLGDRKWVTVKSCIDENDSECPMPFQVIRKEVHNGDGESSVGGLTRLTYEETEKVIQSIFQDMVLAHEVNEGVKAIRKLLKRHDPSQN